MYLKERFLEDVVGGGAIADEADEKMEHFIAIAFNEKCEGGGIAGLVGGEELFIDVGRADRSERQPVAGGVLLVSVDLERARGVVGLPSTSRWTASSGFSRLADRR